MAHLKKAASGHLLKSGDGHLVNDCGVSDDPCGPACADCDNWSVGAPYAANGQPPVVVTGGDADCIVAGTIPPWSNFENAYNYTWEWQAGSNPVVDLTCVKATGQWCFTCLNILWGTQSTCGVPPYNPTKWSEVTQYLSCVAGKITGHFTLSSVEGVCNGASITVSFNGG